MRSRDVRLMSKGTPAAYETHYIAELRTDRPAILKVNPIED